MDTKINEMHESRFKPGQKIEDYTLKEEIASGGMGQVFLAFQESMNRLVAIKFLPAVDQENEDTVARFEREVYMISHLEHPHIVPVYGFGEVMGTPYIVMRHMNGGTLRERFQEGTLNLDLILSVVDQVVTAIDYAHQQGIIHRDIKPSNIFLDERDNAYLADFGLAKTVSGSYDLTRTDEGISGTPEYMSPEQVRGLKLDGRTDIYSMGVIVFQLLSGHPPFSGHNPMDTVLKQISDPVPSIHAYQPQLPKELDDVFLKVLSKDAAERFETARELFDALQMVLSGMDYAWIPEKTARKIDSKSDQDVTSRFKGSEEPTVQRIVPKFSTSSETIQGVHTGIEDTIEGTQGFEITPLMRKIMLFSLVGIILLSAIGYIGYRYYLSINNPFANIEPDAWAAVNIPRSLEFDGSEGVWVIGAEASEVYKLRSDCAVTPAFCGTIVANQPIDNRPQFIVEAGNEILVGRQLAQGFVAISLDGNSRRNIDFPHTPRDAIFVENSIWITNGTDLIELDTNGQELASYPAGSGAAGIVQAGNGLWVALEGVGSVKRFDLISRTFDPDVNLSSTPGQLISMVVSPVDPRLWVTLNRDDTLHQIDSVTGRKIGEISTSLLPLDLVIYDNYVYVAAKGSNEIDVFDAVEGKFLNSIQSIASPTSLAVTPCTPDCTQLWVASDSQGLIYTLQIDGIRP